MIQTRAPNSSGFWIPLTIFILFIACLVAVGVAREALGITGVQVPRPHRAEKPPVGQPAGAMLLLPAPPAHGSRPHAAAACRAYCCGIRSSAGCMAKPMRHGVCYGVMASDMCRGNVDTRDSSGRKDSNVTSASLRSSWGQRWPRLDLRWSPASFSSSRYWGSARYATACARISSSASRSRWPRPRGSRWWW